MSRKGLSLQYHNKEKIAKGNKEINIFKNANNFLLRNAFISIYKSFVRPHLDYGNVKVHQHNNKSMDSKLQTILSSTTLAITRTIKETSRTKIYKELGL